MSSKEVFINLIKDEIFRMIDDRVKDDRPSMPSTAKVYSVSGNEARVKFKNSKGVEKIYTVPILQPNYKIEGVFDGETVDISVKLNIKSKDTVVMAYLSGDYNSPMIVGKLPK